MNVAAQISVRKTKLFRALPMGFRMWQMALAKVENNWYQIAH